MSSQLENNSKIWEDVYASGHKLNYPDDAFVRLLHRFIKPEVGAKVMDYGFGSGVSTLHLARLGCQVSGYEISQSACDLVQARLTEEGLSAETFAGSPGAALPYKTEEFDFIVAWNSLTYNTEDSFTVMLQEFDRILKPGGKMIAAMSAPGDFIDENSDRINGIEKIINTGVQEGAQVIIPTEQDLFEKFFKGKSLQVGKLTYDFQGFGLHQNTYWLMYFEKA